MSSIPKNKQQLQSAIEANFTKLMADYQRVPSHLSRELEIEGNIKGTLVSVCDTAAYLIGWGQLVLKWYQLKSQNKPVDFPETGYKWNQLGLLANSFHQQYQDWQYEKLLEEFNRTTQQILALIEGLTDEQLYAEQWYEKWTLGRMIQFNTSSPMKNVRTKVRRFVREYT